MRQGIFRILVAVAGQVGDFKLAVNRLIVKLAQPAVIVIAVENMVLMNDKVGDHRFNLNRRGRAQGAGANMDLNANVIGMSHVADLLQLGDAAAGANVRLDHL